MRKVLLTIFLLCLNVIAIENDNLIPNNCNTLIGFNIQKITKIPELKNFLNDKSNADLEELRSFGLDPENIKSLVIGMDTNKAAMNPMSFQANPEVLIVATMKQAVNPAKILEKASKDNVEIKQETFQGLELTTLKKDGRSMAMTKLADRTLAIGGYTMVKNSIELQNGTSKANIRKNTQLTKLIESDKMFWVAGIIPEFPQPGPNDPLS